MFNLSKNEIPNFYTGKKFNNLLAQFSRFKIDVKITNLKAGCIGLTFYPPLAKKVEEIALNMGYVVIFAHEYAHTYKTDCQVNKIIY